MKSPSWLTPMFTVRGATPKPGGGTPPSGGCRRRVNIAVSPSVRFRSVARVQISTSWSKSSFLMVPVALLSTSLASGALLNCTVRVSSFSCRSSSITITVMVPVVSPAGMVSAPLAAV